MSNIKELIRDEIRKWQSNIEAKCPESTSSRNYTKEEWNAIYEYNAYTRILSFIDTLPDEPVTDCHDLEEAAEEYATTHLRNNEFPTADSAFKAGAEWMAKQLPLLEDSAASQKGVQEGRRLERQEMPKWRNYGPNIIKDPFITDLGSLVVGEKCIRIYELYNLPGFKND